ncbi:MAG: hypothetical protein V1900_00010 [Candidatus Aenigmatarchaeota archaeon]
MKGIYENIKSMKPADLIKSLFDSNATKNPKYRSRIGEFYGFIEDQGIEIFEVPHAHLKKTFGGDYVGWRQGNKIYVATDKNGRKLKEDEMMAIVGHEYMAGFNHEKSDKEAQKGAIDLFSALGYAPAFAQAVAINERM